MPPLQLILLGDYSAEKLAHQAIPSALERARKKFAVELNWTWLHTSELDPELSAMQAGHALWVVPGSPYANFEGVLTAIRWARETGRPFLGTCGGFQHALIEYARNVAGLTDADHAETNPNAATPLVSPLVCSLVEQTEQIFFKSGSLLKAAYQAEYATEGYRCSYGLNPEYRVKLFEAGLRFTAYDENGAVRGAELPGHPFFAGVLFQPERAALQNKDAPLVEAFVQAIAKAGAR